MTIAVVTACVGKTYHEFLPKWINAVCKLERKPDEIVVATDLIEQEIWLPDGLVRYVPVPDESRSTIGAFAVNQAIAVTESDWICKIDVDDQILPHALNNLDDCEADVYCFGIKINEQDNHAMELTAEIVLEQKDPQIYSNSPYRRWIWEAHPYENIYYEDGVFWYAAAVEGATFAASPNIDYIYGDHENQVTKRVNHVEALENMNRRKDEMLDARSRE